MGWLDWMRRSNRQEQFDTPVDLDRELARGLTDRTAAHRSLARLTGERNALVRRRGAVECGFKRLTRARTVLITRSGRASLDLQDYQFSEALRDENETDRTGSGRKAQIASIEARNEEIDRAIALLRKVGRYVARDENRKNPVYGQLNIVGRPLY